MGTYSNQDVLTGNDHPGISKKILKTVGCKRWNWRSIFDSEIRNIKVPTTGFTTKKDLRIS